MTQAGFRTWIMKYDLDPGFAHDWVVVVRWGAALQTANIQEEKQTLRRDVRIKLSVQWKELIR